MELARRERHPISLLLMDMDHFKSINDRFGNAAGDGFLARYAVGPWFRGETTPYASSIITTRK